MRRKQIRRWLFRVYWWAAGAIAVVAVIITILAPVRLGFVVVGNDLAVLLLVISFLPFLVYLLIAALKLRNSITLKGLGALFALGLTILAIAWLAFLIGLSVWDVVHSPQDAATLAIVWAIAAPALGFATKAVGGGLLAGVGGVAGKDLYESVTQPD